MTFVPSRVVTGPLGRRAQREARHAEERRLLLNAAGVGEDRRRIGFQREELEVSERREEADVRIALGRRRCVPACADAPERRRACARPTVWSCSSTGSQECPVHERRAMQRDEHELSRSELELLGESKPTKQRLETAERVDHRVPDEVDALGVDAFPLKVLDRILASGRTGARRTRPRRSG